MNSAWAFIPFYEWRNWGSVQVTPLEGRGASSSCGCQPWHCPLLSGGWGDGKESIPDKCPVLGLPKDAWKGGQLPVIWCAVPREGSMEEQAQAWKGLLVNISVRPTGSHEDRAEIAAEMLSYPNGDVWLLPWSWGKLPGGPQLDLYVRLFIFVCDLVLQLCSFPCHWLQDDNLKCKAPGDGFGTLTLPSGSILNDK